MKTEYDWKAQLEKRKLKIIKDIEHYFLFIEDIPAKDREAIYGIITNAINNYWDDQLAWEYAKELGNPKAIKELQRSKENLKKDKILILDRALRVVENSHTKIGLLDEIERVKNEDTSVKPLSPKPSKKNIKALIITIFKKYDLKGIDTTLKDLLPQI